VDLPSFLVQEYGQHSEEWECLSNNGKVKQGAFGNLKGGVVFFFCGYLQQSLVS
jgi:hypothetical protein